MRFGALSFASRQLNKRKHNALLDLFGVTFLLVCVGGERLRGWQEFIRPNKHIHLRKDTVSEVQRFGGDENDSDHFKVLLQEGDSLLLGARNMVYDISLITLRENKRIVWSSNEADVNMCELKQNPAEECHNYIRVIIKQNNKDLLVCGTNAFKPWCRVYRNQTGLNYIQLSDENGVGKCPYDPRHNNTAIYVGGRLFSGTVADINARDALIYSKPMRTEQHDSQWLNEPNFVSSFDYGDKVYFFFRETAVEYINCGKSIYSRVARICKNDQGGTGRVLRNTWTSFFKARLNCSIPGEFPFYFDELQSTSSLGRGNYMPTISWDNRTDMVYAVFNTPQNSITGSAVCAFQFRDVIASFEGRFKEQKNAHSNWLPASERETPFPHPAKQCVNDSSSIPDSTLNFIKSHPLMDKAVPAFGGQPILVQTSFKFRLTKIAVDWQVRAADGRYYDVLFIGTDDGRVIKAINKGRGSEIETVIIEDIQVFHDKAAVQNIIVYKRLEIGQEKLVVVSSGGVKAIPLHRCHLSHSCHACVRLQDPYCSWTAERRCQNSGNGLQSVESGRHLNCGAEPGLPSHGNKPEVVEIETTSAPPPTTCEPCVCPPNSGAENGEHTSPDTTTERRLTFPVESREQNVVKSTPFNNHIPVVPEKPSDKDPEFGASRTHGGPPMYSVESMAIATVLCIVISIVVGFVIGYRVSLHRNKDNNSLSSLETTKQDNSNYRHDNYVTSPGLPEKQLNTLVYNNSLKGNMGHYGNAETKVQPKKKKVPTATLR